jgi:RNA polymerase sigma-70 factor, ECF subfamily
LILLLRRRLGGRISDAEDLAQESLARAFSKIDQFDDQYRFSTWLYTIAFRMATDLVRKERRRPGTVSIETQSIVDGRQLECSSLLSSNSSQARDATDVWVVARSVLAESQFTTLWLRYGEGLSAAEIATVTGQTSILVRVQLHRARVKLAKEIRRKEGVYATVTHRGKAL